MVLVGLVCVILELPDHSHLLFLVCYSDFDYKFKIIVIKLSLSNQSKRSLNFIKKSGI